MLSLNVSTGSTHPLDNTVRLARSYVCCLQTFFAFSSVKLNLLAFGDQIDLQRSAVNEQILATLLRSNKTETLSLVEPFNCTFSHTNYLHYSLK